MAETRWKGKEKGSRRQQQQQEVGSGEGKLDRQKIETVSGVSIRPRDTEVRWPRSTFRISVAPPRRWLKYVRIDWQRIRLRPSPTHPRSVPLSPFGWRLLGGKWERTALLEVVAARMKSERTESRSRDKDRSAVGYIDALETGPTRAHVAKDS